MPNRLNQADWTRASAGPVRLSRIVRSSESAKEDMTRKSAAILVVVLAIVVVLADYAIEFMQVDSCLDRGGAFDYSTKQCTTDMSGPTSFPFVPYPVRNLGFLVAVGSSALLLVLGLLHVGKKASSETGS